MSRLRVRETIALNLRQIKAPGRAGRERAVRRPSGPGATRLGALRAVRLGVRRAPARLKRGAQASARTAATRQRARPTAHPRWRGSCADRGRAASRQSGSVQSATARPRNGLGPRAEAARAARAAWTTCRTNWCADKLSQRSFPARPTALSINRLLGDPGRWHCSVEYRAARPMLRLAGVKVAHLEGPRRSRLPPRLAFRLGPISQLRTLLTDKQALRRPRCAEEKELR